MAGLALALLLAACAEEATPAGPRIDRLVPDAAPPGASVEILGEGFGARADGFVTFGGAESAVALWQDTRITAIVPDCLAGAVYVVVTADGDRSDPAPFAAIVPETRPDAGPCDDSGSM